MKILVVDDEKIKRVTLADDLGAQGHDVVAAADGAEAIGKLDQERFDLVVTDLKMPGIDGLDLLKHVKQGPAADVEVIMMTAYGSIPVAVEAMKLGAYDFVTKPFRNEDLFPLIARIERSRQAAEAGEASGVATGQTAQASVDQAIVGGSPAIARVKRMVEVSCRTDANVLLVGETGAGKDLIASVIHRNSHRHGFPLVKVGCTLLPPQLIESELYGHEKGSFTGADQQRPGRFELAEGGTLYLDDVDDIPLALQSKLLRAIEEKVFERVGGSRPNKADVRIVASTKCNLLEKIAAGTFRQDLYYRLDVLRINVPPLRERLEDVPALAERLLTRISEKGDRRLAGTIPGMVAEQVPVSAQRDRRFEIDPEAIEALMRHPWPGNVRELYHALERAYLIGAGRITAELLALASHEPSPGGPVSNGSYQAAMDQAERQLLEGALRAAGGNKTAAAASLGMKPSTFRDRLAKHGLG